ncbi:hypothetical protein BT96DRAFT_1002488 [Gymnopus androsaceus JB14]|uniref:Uncharacterized protein n=1 Tax=Gymnopus androsaceus JB14 TaxID=1447944 RepID=A0A6A4GWS3_9AGAR|nr:hypothetical protein BT96DRAFT_1002488 [Gymnopus androsaceus JB14]
MQSFWAAQGEFRQGNFPYCLQANLQALLDCNHEIQDIIPEALEKLKAINREDHRGSFAETDLSAWSSTVFKSITSTVTLPELQEISIWLSNRYSIPLPHWHGKLLQKWRIWRELLLAESFHSPAGIQLNNSYVVVWAEGPVTSRRAGRNPLGNHRDLRGTFYSRAY